MHTLYLYRFRIFFCQALTLLLMGGGIVSTSVKNYFHIQAARHPCKFRYKFGYILPCKIPPGITEPLYLSGDAALQRLWNEKVAGNPYGELSWDNRTSIFARRRCSGCGTRRWWGTPTENSPGITTTTISEQQ